MTMCKSLSATAYTIDYRTKPLYCWWLNKRETRI